MSAPKLTPRPGEFPKTCACCGLVIKSHRAWLSLPLTTHAGNRTGRTRIDSWLVLEFRQCVGMAATGRCTTTHTVELDQEERMLVPAPDSFPIRCDCKATWTAEEWAARPLWSGKIEGYEHRHCHCGRPRGVKLVEVAAPVEPAPEPLRGMVVANPDAWKLAVGLLAITPDFAVEVPEGREVAIIVAAEGRQADWKHFAAGLAGTQHAGVTHDQVYALCPREHVVAVARIAKVIKPDPNPRLTKYLLAEPQVLPRPVPLVVGGEPAAGYTGRGIWTLDTATTRAVRVELGQAPAPPVELEVVRDEGAPPPLKRGAR